LQGGWSEGVAENAHLFAVMFAGRLERGEGFPLLKYLHKHFVDKIAITKNGKTFKRTSEVFD